MSAILCFVLFTIKHVLPSLDRAADELQAPFSRFGLYGHFLLHLFVNFVSDRK